MRFALLCDDPMVRPVVDALSDPGGKDQLRFAVRATEHADDLLHQRQAITFVEKWEDLPVEREIDAVLVGGRDSVILDGIKQLASGGTPILFAPHAGQGSTFIYELSLIRDDNQVPLIPLLWHRYDRAVLRLKQAIDEGRLGRVQFLQLTRALTRPMTNTPLSQSEVDAELLQDTDLLRWLIGDYDQVTCLRTGASTEGVMMQSVVLSGRSLPEANWNIAPIDGPNQWRLIVRFETGVAELHRSGSSHHWICEIDGERIEGDSTTTSQNLLDDFTKSMNAHKALAAAHQKAEGSDWAELVKCYETVDATHRSIKRRRTIELHFEPMSERAIFKTQMTAMGCSLLVATFFLLLLYLGVASFVAPLPFDRFDSDMQITNSTAAETIGINGNRVPKSLPFAHRLLVVLRLLVFAPLLIFLVAQFLLPLARPSSNEQPTRHQE